MITLLLPVMLYPLYVSGDGLMVSLLLCVYIILILAVFTI